MARQSSGIRLRAHGESFLNCLTNGRVSRPLGGHRIRIRLPDAQWLIIGDTSSLEQGELKCRMRSNRQRKNPRCLSTNRGDTYPIPWYSLSSNLGSLLSLLRYLDQRYRRKRQGTVDIRGLDNQVIGH